MLAAEELWKSTTMPPLTLSTCEKGSEVEGAKQCGCVDDPTKFYQVWPPHVARVLSLGANPAAQHQSRQRSRLLLRPISRRLAHTLQAATPRRNLCARRRRPRTRLGRATKRWMARLARTRRVVAINVEAIGRFHVRAPRGVARRRRGRNVPSAPSKSDTVL